MLEAVRLPRRPMRSTTTYAEVNAEIAAVAVDPQQARHRRTRAATFSPSATNGAAHQHVRSTLRGDGAHLAQFEMVATSPASPAGRDLDRPDVNPGRRRVRHFHRLKYRGWRKNRQPNSPSSVGNRPSTATGTWLLKTLARRPPRPCCLRPPRWSSPNSARFRVVGGKQQINTGADLPHHSESRPGPPAVHRRPPPAPSRTIIDAFGWRSVRYGYYPASCTRTARLTTRCCSDHQLPINLGHT